MAQVQRRIPTEEEITIAFRRLDDSPWATILARMLIYGVRPHEAHLGTITDDGLFLVPSNTKTGERIVPPFDKRPGWVRRARGPLPKVKATTNRDYGVRTYQAFTRRDVPFNPYDARHRFIVLSEERGIPPAIAAIWAGHSTRTRYAVYMKTLDQRRALKYAIDNGYLLTNKSNHSINQQLCPSLSLIPTEH
jgi:hypothetical protein